MRNNKTLKCIRGDMPHAHTLLAWSPAIVPSSNKGLIVYPPLHLLMTHSQNLTNLSLGIPIRPGP